MLISGQTSSTYTNGSVQAADAGAYTVVVSNSMGSVTSAAADVMVNAAAAAAPATSAPAGGGGGGGAPAWAFIWRWRLAGGKSLDFGESEG